MEKCYICGAETQLFISQKPVCVECDRRATESPSNSLALADRGETAEDLPEAPKDVPEKTVADEGQPGGD